MDDRKEEAKERLRGVMRHFRLAVADAKKIGEPKLSINGEQPDGSGQRIMSFNAEEFFADLAIVIDAPPDTVEDEMDAKARSFMQKHGLTVDRGE